MKKSLILLTALLCSLFTFAASGKCGANLKWNYDKKTQTLTITGSGAMDDYEEHYDRKSKKWKGNKPWLKFKNEIVRVILPEGLTRIGRSAFSMCENLSDCNIPNSVQTIGSGAFFGSGIREIVIPNGVHELDGFTFCCCYKLTSIYIPASVTSIESGYIIGSDKLCYIHVAQDNPNYCSVDGVLIDKKEKILISYPQGKTDSTYTIPADVVSIGFQSFNNHKYLTSVVVPGTVNTIDVAAFIGCKNLTEVTILDGVKLINQHAFFSCKNLLTVDIPSSVTLIVKDAFDDCPKVQINMSGSNTTFVEHDEIEKETQKIGKDGFVWYKVTKKGVCAVKDKNNRIIIPYSREYSNISYSGGFFTVYRYNKIGICDMSGKEIISPKYDSDSRFFDKQGDFYCADAYGVSKPIALYDSSGRVIIDESWKYTIFAVKDDVIWGYNSKEGATHDLNGNYLATGHLSLYEATKAKERREAQIAAQQETRQQQSSGPSRAEIAIAVMQGLAEGLSSASSSNTSNNYNSSSNTSTSNNAGVLVGNYTAYGLSKSFGNTVTHSQTFAVYRDSRGYYIIDPKWKTNNYLRANTDRTYFDYPVGAYNYRTMTSLGSDVHWFFKL